MGLIAAAWNAAGGTLASQWKEYFYVDSLPDNVLATKAEKKVKARFGGSRREDDNVISDGSVVAVADGQCMMIVDQGKIVDFCAEPGEYVFEQGGEPSIFYGPFNGEKIESRFENHLRPPFLRRSGTAGISGSISSTRRRSWATNTERPARFPSAWWTAISVWTWIFPFAVSANTATA